MSYFGTAYRRRGDPGLFDTLVNVGRTAGGILGIGKTGGGLLGGGAITPRIPGISGILPPQPQPGNVVPVPGIEGIIQRALPGGATGLMVQGFGRKRRRMNFGNTKALNRSIRRVEGFGRLVQKSKKSVAKANRALNPQTSRRSAVPAGHKSRLSH